ncbi:MAG: FG-GAP-like repeat-containing protein [Bacteroidia bacterium]
MAQRNFLLTVLICSTFYLSNAQFTPSSFAPRIDFPLSTGVFNAQGLTSADLNGDGKPDLIVGSVNTSTIRILKNTSSGTTISVDSPQFLLTSIATVNEIATGDLDGDDKPDIVACPTSSAGNSFSIFRNTSTTSALSFAARIDIASSNYPASVRIFDADGDGKNDIVVINYYSNTISVFRNTSTGIGNISFATKVDYSTGSYPGNLDVGDIDGDGKIDIAVLNDGDSSISVYKNNSTSGIVSFSSPILLHTPSTPAHAQIVDIDGDGKKDIACTNFYGFNFTIFRNTSSGGTVSFASRVDVPIDTGTAYAQGIAIADYDGDGKPDIAASDHNYARVVVFKNATTSGTITSSSFSNKCYYPTGIKPNELITVDMDGDGDMDIISSNYQGYSVSILQNRRIDVGINSFIEKKFSFSLWPNPVKTFINIDNPTNETLTVKLFDFTGKQLFNFKPVSNDQMDGSALLTINVSALKSGNYLLIIESSDGKYFCKKFIKE